MLPKTEAKSFLKANYVVDLECKLFDLTELFLNINN